MIAPGPTLETERLILRPTATQDLDGWAELMGDAEAARFIGGQMGRAQAWRMMATMAGSWAINGFAMFSVIEKASGQWIGRIGPWRPEGWPGTEVGWSLLPRVHGRGYAVEAATATMDWAVDHLGWTRLVHCIDPANLASIEVARRIGSRFLEVGRLPAPYEDVECHIWGQTAEDWKARRGAA